MKTNGGCFWFSVFVNFPSPNMFVNFFCRESWWGNCPWIIFIQIYFTLFMIYASRLRFYEPFLPMRSSVLVLCFFSPQPDVNITWITGHIHCSIVGKIEPTSEYVEMAKKTNLSITLGYKLLWSVIRRIYLPCLQFISKNTFDEPWRGPPPFFFNLKSGKMSNDDICSGKLFTRSVCCFGFRLGIDFNW